MKRPSVFYRRLWYTVSMSLFDNIHELSILTILLRLFLAVVLGGVIGLERGANKHPAGFRTHILVCVGAALAMLTNQYIFDYFGPGIDPGRLGAQVITGVGFLGVGTILVTGRYKIKGLTTAAGLWASACIGLAVGIGFYSGAIIAAALVFISLALLPKLEATFYEHSRTLGIYAEIESIKNFKPFISAIKDMDITVTETHLDKSAINVEGAYALNLFVRLPKDLMVRDVIDELNDLPYVLIVEEI